MTEELAATLKHLEPGKSPGLDSILLEFIVHAGLALKSWSCDFLTSCMHQLKIPRNWRRTLILAIPKLGKLLGDPKSYRCLSLPCDPFKILTGTWSVWSWSWLAITASPYHWQRQPHPTGIRPGTLFSSKSTSLTCQPPSPESMHISTIMHADGDWQFSSVYLCIPTKHKILYQEYRDRKRRP